MAFEQFGPFETDETNVAPSLMELMEEAIRISSFSCEENDIMDYLESVAGANLLAGAGLEVLKGDFGVIVVARGKDGVASPLILGDGHIDTVDVNAEEAEQWTTDPFEPVVEEVDGRDVIKGKGSVDQQGGYMAYLKALLEMAASIPQKQRECSIGILLTRAEEIAEGHCGMLGMKKLQELGYPLPDTIVSTEPTESKVIRGQVGRMMLDIKNLGADPTSLFKVITKLATYERTAELTGRSQGLVLVGADVHELEFTGESYSKVADRATISFDLSNKSLDEDGVACYVLDFLGDLKEGGELKDSDYSLEDNVLTVEIFGQAAHSAFPERGVNAGVAMAKLANAMEDRYPEALLRGARVGEGEIALAFKGGNLIYDYRIDVGETPDDFIGRIRGMIVEALGDEASDITIEIPVKPIELDGETHPVRQYYPGYRRSGPKERLLSEIVNGENPGGGDTPDDGSDNHPFATNLNGYKDNLSAKTEFIIFGPGDPALSHNPNEYCPVDEAELVCRSYQKFIAALFAGMDGYHA